MPRFQDHVMVGQMITPDFMLRVDAERLRRSLYDFAVAAWPVLEPATPFIDNWHVRTICDHLQAVTEGKIRRLIINIPPRFMKSLLVSVLWPAWIWVTSPAKKFLTASYAQSLAERDAVKMRTLIDSPWYQQRFQHVFCFKADQNAKSRYENDKTGFRVSVSPNGLGTGEGGDYLIVDDPHNVKQAESDVQRTATTVWWDETMSSRYNNPKTGAAVIVMQRIHEEDLAGHLIKKGGWAHLCIPMSFELPNNGKRRTTILGDYDPRHVENELLWPERFGPEEVEMLSTALGSFGTAGQLQQSPSPRGGGILKRDNYRFYTQLPKIVDVVITVDCTFKGLDTSDNVSIQAWGTNGIDKYLLHRVKQKMGYNATVKALESVIAKFPHRIAILIEDKANGSAVIETLSQKFTGVIPINPDGGKVARAYAMQPEHESGHTFLPDPSIEPTIEEFLSESDSFPNGSHDDEIDAMTQYYNWDRVRSRSSGMLDFMTSQLAARNAKTPISA